MATRKVVTRRKDWKAIVQRADKDHNKPNDVVYKWSNGREHKTTDHTSSGIYEK
ncbi:hypothetical protein LCGC14_3097790 [marine sediment metagenome]|uniref:Uncharacterized protein n=1 Tax=marine sediment metagenome TaxID=412755 RepID=A0A0F8YG27_9ZZZZ